MAILKTDEFSGFLHPEQSAPIFADAQRRSTFQQLFRRIPLGINGNNIPVVTTKPTANWVGEGKSKPKTSLEMSLLQIKPQKLAAISVMSAEVVRANPGNFTAELREGLAEAFAMAFDYAVGFGVGGDGAGSGPFQALAQQAPSQVQIGSTAREHGGIHGDFAAALNLSLHNGGRVTGFALSELLEPDLWGAVDTNGRPLYIDLPTDDTSGAITRPGRLLGRPSFMGAGLHYGGPVMGKPDAEIVGFAGDFTKGAWGAVGGISYRLSTEASVTIGSELVSLWENNLVAVLAEAEYGFVLAEAESFVTLTR